MSVLPQDVLLISCGGVRAANGRMKVQGGILSSSAVSISVHAVQERILGPIKRSILVPISREME